MYLKVLAFNSTTNAYESATLNFDGTAYTPTPPERPLTATDFDTIETVWAIVTAGTGYSVGDTVSQFTFLKQGPPAEVAATLWYNQTTGAALASAPLAGHRKRVSSLVATETTLSALNTKVPAQGVAASSAAIPVVIASNDAQFGNKSTSATLPTGGLGLLGWVSDAYRLILSAFTQSSAPFSKISDGTNTATVKAASTAAVAADTAIVTTLSPSSAPAKTVVVDSTNSFVMPTGDAAARALAVTSMPLDVTPVATFSVNLNDNALTGNATEFDLQINGRLYSNFIMRIEGNTAITAGAIVVEGAHSTLGPWQTLRGTVDQGATTLALTTPVASNQITEYTAYNWNNFRYIRCRINTAFTGTATGVRVAALRLYPFGVTSPAQQVITGGANLPMNQTQIGGIAVATGSGAQSTGTQRVVQAQLTTNFLGAVPATVSDLIVAGRIRKIKLLNENAAVLYIGIYNSAAALTATSVPLNGLVWRVPANSDFFLGVGDFGESGTFFATTTRVGISSTRNTYTALTVPQLAACALFIEGV
jgi:hypothetical protein